MTDETPDQMILVTVQTWEQIRHLFAEDEKNAMREASCGESVCPPAAILDRRKISEALAVKLSDAKRAVEKMSGGTRARTHH
jgi:hypothetical protein